MSLMILSGLLIWLVLGIFSNMQLHKCTLSDTDVIFMTVF